MSVVWRGGRCVLERAETEALALDRGYWGQTARSLDTALFNPYIFLSALRIPAPLRALSRNRRSQYETRLKAFFTDISLRARSSQRASSNRPQPAGGFQGNYSQKRPARDHGRRSFGPGDCRFRHLQRWFSQ